jgi:DNA-nicking Smr family endonuclease
MTRGDRHRGRALSAEEHLLWRKVTRSIAPIPKRDRAAAEADGDSVPQAAAEGAQSPADTGKPPQRVAPARPVAIETPVRPRVAAPVAIDRRTKQRLSRGTMEIDARLDLHGYRQHTAHETLLRFLRGAQADGARFVLIITGKGTRGEGEDRGVLRRQVPLWLGLPEFRPYVAGFGNAAIGHGGEGALYVRLRRRRGHAD